MCNNMGIKSAILERKFMTRCKVCEGRKTVLGMGNMRETCNSCDGKGFLPEEKIKIITIDKEPEEKIFKENIVKLKEKKENRDGGQYS